MARKQGLSCTKDEHDLSEEGELVNSQTTGGTILCISVLCSGHRHYPGYGSCKGNHIQIGAENMYFEEKGAFTGEISLNMLVGRR